MQQILVERGTADNGLVAVLGTREMMSMSYIESRQREKSFPLLTRIPPRCLHYYYGYRDDGHFGLPPLRLSSGFPFGVHVGRNGREWPAQGSDKTAQRLCAARPLFREHQRRCPSSPAGGPASVDRRLRALGWACAASASAARGVLRRRLEPRRDERTGGVSNAPRVRGRGHTQPMVPVVDNLPRDGNVDFDRLLMRSSAGRTPSSPRAATVRPGGRAVADIAESWKTPRGGLPKSGNPHGVAREDKGRTQRQRQGGTASRQWAMLCAHQRKKDAARTYRYLLTESGARSIVAIHPARHVSLSQPTAG